MTISEYPEQRLTSLPAPPPTSNFEMTMGDGLAQIDIQMRVEKTLLNRIKWWLFFQYSPFKLKRWDND